MLTCNIDNITIKIYFDTHGNLYFNREGDIYQLCLDKNDEPELCKIICDEHIKYDIKEDTHFRGKIIKNEKNIVDETMIEDSGHDLVLDGEYDEMYDSDKYVFYGDISDEEIIHIADEYDANYDTYLYDKDGILKLTVKICDCIGIYRVSIYENGSFYFRSLGNVIEKKYAIKISEDNMIFIKNN